MKKLGKTMIKDLISVLMPTYNVEAYIEEAVNSILIQTYKKFELIIVDDFSTDKTYEILSQISRKDNRIRLFRNKTNQKICKTLNFALKQARGEFIARMDGDDVSCPERFEIMLDFLKNNQEYSLIGSQVYTIDEFGNIISKRRLLMSYGLIKFFSLFQSNILHIWLARSDVYRELNGYRNMPYIEDYDFILRAIQKGYKIKNLSRYLYKVRIRNGNTGSTNGLKQNKAKIFIQNLYKNKALLEKDAIILYEKAISIRKKESNDFDEAYKHMICSLLEKKDLFKKLKEFLMAITNSYFIFRNIFISMLIKSVAFVEYILLKIKIKH